MSIRVNYAVVILAVLSSSLVLPKTKCFSSELSSGAIYNISISAEGYNRLIRFGTNPTEEKVAEILELIRQACPDSNFKKVVSTKPVIVFLGIGGVDRFLYLKKSYYGEHYTLPTETEIVKQRDDPKVFVIYIVDESRFLVNTLQVDIANWTPSFSLGTLQSRSPNMRYGHTNEPREIELGIKMFRIPFTPSAVRLTFLQKDIETFDERTWVQSYRVRDTRGIRDLFSTDSFEWSFFVPFSKADIERYEIRSNTIVLEKENQPVFLALLQDNSDLRRTYREARSPHNQIVKYLMAYWPDISLGVGLPPNINRTEDNVLLAGLGWPIMRGLVGFTVGVRFFWSEQLKPGYKVGDDVGPRAISEIIEWKNDYKVTLGASISLNFADNSIY